MRVSTADKGQDVAMQRSACVDFCEKNDWQYDIFEEKKSGKTTKRPELQHMMELIEAGAFQIVVAYKIDRISRSTRDLYNIVDFLKKHDCDLVMVTQREIDTTTPMGKAFFGIMSIMAELESDMISQRVRDGMAEKKKKGAKFGGDRRGHSYRIAKIYPFLGKWSLEQIRKHLRMRREQFYSTIEFLEAKEGRFITDYSDERYRATVRPFKQKRVDSAGNYLNPNDPKIEIEKEKKRENEKFAAEEFVESLEKTGTVETFVNSSLMRTADKLAEVDIDDLFED